MTEVLFKNNLSDYTEAEFLRFLKEFFEETETLPPSGVEYDRYMDRLSEHFEKVTAYPTGKDLIFWGPESVEDSPEGILQEVKRWRAEQGLPGFKQ